MIDESLRFFAHWGTMGPHPGTKWGIVDWDSRRTIVVHMDEEQEEADEAIEHLQKHIDTLDPDVYEIHVAYEGQLLSVSRDLKDDGMNCVFHPPLSWAAAPSGTKTIYRSQFREEDRLGPNVDLVSYPTREAALNASQPNRTLAVFKYYFLPPYINRCWEELNLWMRLPRDHPNIVPFDRIVLSEQDATVVGFTTLFIPGGTVDENKARTFRLDWLKQLTRAIDDLNLIYGIMHQDIAARNLLVNPNTQQLMVFDFNFSARIGSQEYSASRNDVDAVVFTVYEIITRDQTVRSVPHDEQDVDAIQQLDDWPQHPDVSLDHSVSDFRSVIDDWVKERRSGRQLSMHTEATHYIDWPKVPGISQTASLDERGDIVLCKDGLSLFNSRNMERKRGHKILEWTRPPQSKLNDQHVLANGQFVTKK